MPTEEDLDGVLPRRKLLGVSLDRDLAFFVCVSHLQSLYFAGIQRLDDGLKGGVVGADQLRDVGGEVSGQGYREVDHPKVEVNEDRLEILQRFDCLIHVPALQMKHQNLLNMHPRQLRNSPQNIGISHERV